MVAIRMENILFKTGVSRARYLRENSTPWIIVGYHRLPGSFGFALTVVSSRTDDVSSFLRRGEWVTHFSRKT
jgi:hypothetical protein